MTDRHKCVESAPGVANDESKIRFTRGHTCAVCGGSDNDPRGQGQRCMGFRAGEWIHCSREEYAGRAKFHEGSQTYSHKAKGACPCGEEHARCSRPSPSFQSWDDRSRLQVS